MQMMYPTPMVMPEVVDREELRQWRKSLRHKKYDAPTEVCSFINAISDKLPDFGRIKNMSMAISGRELKLSGMNDYNGEHIHDTFLYELPVPYMIAQDHHLAMHRIYERRGKQGLIDYCRARVESNNLKQVLEILNVHVFHEEREEFKKVMDVIKSTHEAI